MKNTEPEDYLKKIITIPNILSVLRLCMIPLIMWLYIAKEDAFLTALVLVLSGVTDVADGIIARKFHMISDFGKALDPVADKLTQIAMMLCLVNKFPYMILPLGVLVVKEFVTGIMSLLSIRKSGQVDGAVWHGKVTTVLLYSVMTLHLIWINIPETVSYILVGMITGMMLFSAAAYGIRNAKILTAKGES